LAILVSVTRALENAGDKKIDDEDRLSFMRAEENQFSCDSFFPNNETLRSNETRGSNDMVQGMKF
jgi:hypothetical protein